MQNAKSETNTTPNPETSTELEHVILAFGQLTRRVLEGMKHDVELARASNNHDALIRAQVKKSTLETARAMFTGAYKHVTKRNLPDDF